MNSERPMKKSRIIALSIAMIALSALSALGASRNIVAHGDGFVVTSKEVKAMRAAFANGGFQPSSKGLLEGTVKIVLFAKQALREGFDCPSVSKSTGFSRTIALSNCYLRTRLGELDVGSKAVESYYRANWRRFVDKKTGELHPFDSALQERIKKRILTAKKKNFGRQEFKRLCKEYNVVFGENGS